MTQLCAALSRRLNETSNLEEDAVLLYFEGGSFPFACSVFQFINYSKTCLQVHNANTEKTNKPFFDTELHFSYM